MFVPEALIRFLLTHSPAKAGFEFAVMVSVAYICMVANFYLLKAGLRLPAVYAAGVIGNLLTQSPSKAGLRHRLP